MATIITLIIQKIIGMRNLNIKKYIAPHGACTMYKVKDLKKLKVILQISMHKMDGMRG